MAAVFLLVFKCYSQQVDFRSMTPELRNAYSAKINAASWKDRKQMLDQLDIVLPQLPNDSLDPRRPPNIFKRPGSNNWTDSAGQFYARSDWGHWTNFNESNTGKYTLPTTR